MQSRNSILTSVAMIGAVVLCVAGTTLRAHHSTTAFDSSKTMTVNGIVAKFEWTNPHVYVWVNVPDASHLGRYDLYAFESASPNVLELGGWNRTILKAGDRITIDYAPRRDGRNGGLWILGRRADGLVLRGGGDPIARGRLTQGAAQTGSAQCPRAEVVEVMPKASAETRPVAYRNGTIHVSRAPLSTMNDVVAVAFNPPQAIGLTFTPEVGERMERITGSRPNFPLAFVVDNDAVLSVVLEGGFGIGKDGLQISVDGNFDRIKMIYDTLSRCVAARSKR